MFINVVRNDTIELVAERAAGWRIFTYVFAVVVVAFFGILMAQIPGPPVPRGTVPVPTFNVMWLFVFAIVGLILWFGSPHEIRFNLRKGTYTARQGFLFFSKPITGTFQDFYGLCIRPNRNKRGWIVGYRIELDWNDPKRGPFELVSSLNLDKARLKQQEIAAKLHITQLGCEE